MHFNTWFDRIPFVRFYPIKWSPQSHLFKMALRMRLPLLYMHVPLIWISALSSQNELQFIVNMIELCNPISEVMTIIVTHCNNVVNCGFPISIPWGSALIALRITITLPLLLLCISIYFFLKGGHKWHSSWWYAHRLGYFSIWVICHIDLIYPPLPPPPPHLSERFKSSKRKTNKLKKMWKFYKYTTTKEDFR